MRGRACPVRACHAKRRIMSAHLSDLLLAATVKPYLRLWIICYLSMHLTREITKFLFNIMQGVSFMWGGKRSSCYEVYFMCKSVSVRVHLTSYQIQYICFLWVKLFLRLLYLKNYIFGRSLCVCVHVGGGGASQPSNLQINLKLDWAKNALKYLKYDIWLPFTDVCSCKNVETHMISLGWNRRLHAVTLAE